MHWLLTKFTEFNEKSAIVSNDKLYTYLDLNRKVNSYSEEVSKAGIKSGEVVTILADYSFESISLFIALMINKNIVVPVTSVIDSEIVVRVDESYTDVILTINNDSIQVERRNSQEKHEMLNSLSRENSAGLILFSSGSTGKPKAMIHNLDNLVNSFESKKQKKLNFLVFLMFDHIGGLNTLFNTLSMGALIVLPKLRDAEEVGRLIESYEINVLPATPTFLNLMLIADVHNKYNLRSLKMITYGTESMPDSLLAKLKGVFRRVKLLQTFGTSETGIAQTTSKSSDSNYLKIDDPNLEYKIVNDELWLKSKTQILGYLNASMESFTEDGWFKTGDLVEVIDDNYLKIIGRNKEVINVGGEKVLPSEVETVILEIPEITDCMAYSEKNPITGQTVAIDVSTESEMELKEVKKLIRKFCSGKLDKYKIPTKVNIVDKTNYSDRFKKIRRKNA